MREIKKQIAYKIKPSLYIKIVERANIEGKSINEFMQDIHYNYLKRKKAL
jgi:uncharacterized protein (DUF1778 family)